MSNSEYIAPGSPGQRCSPAAQSPVYSAAPQPRFRQRSEPSMADEHAIHNENEPIRALPGNVTFHDLIRANKRKSAILMIAMVLLLVVIGALFTAGVVAYSGDASSEILLPSAITGAVAALVIGVIASLWSLYGGSRAILAMSGAKELPRERDPQLHNVVEELCIAAGIPKPKVYLIEDDAPNAFATGRDPAHAAVAITTALREQLTRDELAAVMAHEITHVRHYDIRFAMLMATMVGLIVFASDAMRRMFFYGMIGRGGRRGGGGGKGNPIALILIVIALILAIIAPLLALLIRFAVSRQREYLADAGAVELTRYPQGLIGALEKLGSSTATLDRGNRATAHLYIVNPLRTKKNRHELNSAFRTHPPLHDRIRRLQALIT